MTDRYAGKPFLPLLEAYLRDAIGHLPPAEDAALAAREAEFRAMFGQAGDWRTIVAARMRFPAGMAGAVREVWEKGRVTFAATHGREPDPAEFVRHFVDAKFPH